MINYASRVRGICEYCESASPASDLRSSAPSPRFHREREESTERAARTHPAAATSALPGHFTICVSTMSADTTTNSASAPISSE
jgi:hypothetical protein